MIKMNNVDKLTEKIDALLSEKESVIIALDGPCGAGKTTLAEALAKKYDANVFHADDFFLRREQRSAERNSQIGGNIDYERLSEEVIIPLSQGKEFSFHPFSCKTLSLADEVFVSRKKLNIIEGSYSHHPYFGDVYDLKVFIDIAPEEQKKRILKRNPENAERFFIEWILKENQYFEFFEIKKKADMIL